MTCSDKSAWITSLDAWFATSEVNPGCGNKHNSAKKLTAVSLVAAAAMGAGLAQAQIAIGTSDPTSAATLQGSASAAGVQGIAVGELARATGDYSIVIGRNAYAGSQQQVSIGIQAGLNSTNADYSTSVGASAGTFANGSGNTALGFGSGQVVTGRGNTAVGAVAGQAVTGDYNFTGGYKSGLELSGNANVGVGVRAGQGVVGNTNVAIGNFAGAIVDPANPGVVTPLAINNTVAIGNTARASADNAVAFGTNALATLAGGVALGSGSVASTAAGIAGYKPAGADAAQVAAIDATKSTLAAVSVGDAANGAYRQITGLAAGTQDGDAVNVSQLKAATLLASSTWSAGNVASYTAPAATGAEALATGSGASASGAHAMANGNFANASGQNALAVGNNSVASAASSTALGQGAVAGVANSVALGTGSVAVRGAQTAYAAAGLSAAQTSAGEVSVGSAGQERQLTNVAAGSAGSDAVNVNQLNGAIAPIQTQLNAISQRIDDVSKNADAGTAATLAMASMPQASNPGKNMMSAGVASYQGQSALAVGISRLSESGKWVMKFNGSANSRGKVGVAVGAGFQW